MGVTIWDMRVRYPFRSKVVGISNYQRVAARCKVGDEISVRREPDNPYDSNAYVVLVGEECLGYLPRELARRLTEGGGGELAATIAEKYDAKATIGIEILVVGESDEGAGSERPHAAPSAATARGPKARAVRAKRSGRLLGTLTRVDRESRRVYVEADGSEISYPDGLVDIVEH